MRFIDARLVRELLPVADCVELMAQAMRNASAGRIAMPTRMVMPLADHSGQVFVMPGSALEPRVYGAKLLNVHPTNPQQGRPLHQGFVALFDHDTGVPLAIVEGSELTLLRTAAASALATRTLARAAAGTHGIFGTGRQAGDHVRAIAGVRAIRRVVIWGRTGTRASALAAELSDSTGSEVIATSDPREAAACDVVTTVTAAGEPVLQGAWLIPGTHLNLVGAHSPVTREVDDDAARRSTIYVDRLASAFSEAGDILIPLGNGTITRDAIVGEIGQVLQGTAPGRRDVEQITLYKSLGTVAQDILAAACVYRRAIERGAGSEVSL
ncbi:ornithine cyclodeaminase family protein [Luteimonas marina]|uniref:Ornithine cyclodeaminase family protein n=1 Tax=Luteimonas marina TaxID=488485 RepID=A0A5C5TX45_9GAMM|nr:ornithine cyclodeaminase family protein [Luteimonas marina]TWT18711.1 ornithine cyclodeaminase family protein [Luteimonas marina]